MAKPLYRAIDGTQDFFDKEGQRFDKVINFAADMFARYGYARIRTPIFEATELFSRSIGTVTDIVEKEMYTFKPGSESITLRPEGTAGTVRAYLQHGMDNQGGLVKLWYDGPMFRRERPQKGRKRQFHQIGIEAIGSADPLLDAEVITVGLRYYESLGIADIGLRINSIGCRKEECRPKFRRLLKETIQPNLDKYCKSCQARFERNVLRIIDCKDENCQELNKNLPKSYDHLCGECADHFDKVKEGVTALGGNYTLDHTLVRGLDYYARTVFEYTHGSLGAQSAIGGGGRYDGLVEELGGKETPAIGFALGVERILIALEAANACACSYPLQVYGVTQGEAAHRAMAGLLARLRAVGLSADMDYEGKSLKAQMRTANRRQAMCCLILGEDELGRGEVTLKRMGEGGGQEAVSLFEVIETVRKAVSWGE